MENRQVGAAVICYDMQVKITLLSKTTPKNADELVKVLLENRGITNENQKAAFLKPKSPNDISPEEVEINVDELKKAQQLIDKAIKEKQRVLVYGDYDADGVCATAILWETLYEMGADVLPFIPHREKHGYGMTISTLEEIFEKSEKKPDLIITVDNGIVAHAAFQWLLDRGVQTILTDHHQIDETGYPPATAIVHTTKLCGATVAWMLAKYLHPEKAATLLDLCGIATIADQVQLLEANRSFAKHGLAALRDTKRIGLIELISLAGLQKDRIDERAVNYAIAPRINAMGRIGSALEALRAICSKNPKHAKQMVGKLHDTNAERQGLTTSLIEQALVGKSSWENEHIIVIDSFEFHEGVVGLVAGRLTELFFKPAIVISKNDGRTAKGSARSIPGVNITEMLREVREHLVDIGGHPMAAGFSIQEKEIDAFRVKLQNLAKSQITSEMMEKTIYADCELNLREINREMYDAIQQLHPFGQGNYEPQFLLKKVSMEKCKFVGKQKEHLSCEIAGVDESGNKVTLSAIKFGHSSQAQQIPNSDERVDVVAKLSLNEWMGREKLQAIILDTV